MSKYCPIADAVTNCTDNCKGCLAEENAQTNVSRINQLVDWNKLTAEEKLTFIYLLEKAQANDTEV